MKAARAEPDIDLVFANAIRVRDDLDGLQQFRDKENHGLPPVMKGSDLRDQFGAPIAIVGKDGRILISGTESTTQGGYTGDCA